MDNEQIKSCMDALAARIVEAIVTGDEPRRCDTAALTALALYRLDDEGIEIVGPVGR